MKIHEIPGKLTTEWNPEVRAIIDTMTTYRITIEELRITFLEKGLKHAKANNGQAWIVDLRNASGLFHQEQLDLINIEIFPALKKNGIKYFIPIMPENNIFAEETVKKYSSMTGMNGLQMIEVNNVDQAILWLKTYAN